MPNREHALAGALFALSVGVVGAGATYVAYNVQPRMPVDADHCPATPVGTWMAAVDATDSPPPHEQRRAADALKSIADRMHKHERLALHVITGNPNNSAAPAPLPDRAQGFSLCKPTDPKTVNRHIDNVRFAREIYQRDFLAPLSHAAAELSKGGKANQSPILEALEVMLWSPHFRATVPQRTLVLFSDLEHNTTGYSHLSGGTLDVCQVLTTSIGRRLARHNWTGVRVVLEQIRNPRDAQYQTADHFRLWTDLFYRLGAAAVFDGETIVDQPTNSCPVDATPKPKASVSEKTNSRKK